MGVLWLTGEGPAASVIGFLQYVRTFADRVSQISEQFNALMMALAVPSGFLASWTCLPRRTGAR